MWSWTSVCWKIFFKNIYLVAPGLIYLFIFIFIFGCVGSSFLCEGFLQLWQAGASHHRGARASHSCGLSCCGAQAPDVQAQQLWPTGPVAPWHVGSSQTRARTRVPCIGRQILNHCATREARIILFIYFVLEKHLNSFFPFLVACEILVSQPGIEPMPPAVEVRSLNHWTTREVPENSWSHLQISKGDSVMLAIDTHFRVHVLDIWH